MRVPARQPEETTRLTAVTSTGQARALFALAATTSLGGVLLQLVVTGTGSGEGAFFSSRVERTLNVLAFFTVESNLIVGATCLLLALDPRRDSPIFRAARLSGVVSIAVTGVVFHTLLAGLDELTGWRAAADFLLHTATPVLAVIGWVLAGPRGRISASTVALATVFPVLWIIGTLIRGPLVGGFYPYPFIDVDELGYGRVLLNVTGVAVLFVGLAALAWRVDGALPGVRPETSRPAVRR